MVFVLSALALDRSYSSVQNEDVAHQYSTPGSLLEPGVTDMTGVAGASVCTGSGTLDPVTSTTSTTAAYSRVAEGNGGGEGVTGSPSSRYGTSASSDRCEDVVARAEFEDTYCGLSKDEVSNKVVQ